MDINITRARNRRWIWIGAIWCGVGLFDALQSVFVMRAEGMHHAWSLVFVTLFLRWLPWAFATPLVMWLGRRYPPVAVRPLSVWFVHLGTAAAMGMTAAAWMALLETLLRPWAPEGGSGGFSEIWLLKFCGDILSSLILYAFILTISFLFYSRERQGIERAENARLNEQIANAQLSALRRQIEPHFIFNALNAVAGLVREQRNEAAVSMIVRLSDFLRRVVNDPGGRSVPLAQELEFLEQYMDIQTTRFGERLKLTVDIPKELHAALVPDLILQPLVENAVKHGISKRVQGGTVRVAASRANGTLALCVHNDGPPLSEDWEKGAGIGIANLRTRLEIMYHHDFELSLRNHAAGGVQVAVTLPYREN